VDSDISSLDLEDFIFFNVETNDSKNTKIVGQTNNYCWENICVIPDIISTFNK